MSLNPDGELSVFQFHSHPVRSVLDERGEPWFVGADVALAMGYRDAHNAMRQLDDDEKGTHIVNTPGGAQSMIVTNESGVYRLIFTSRKPEAEAFKRWLAHEVIPALRKTGAYSVHPTLVDVQKQVRQSRPFADSMETRVAALIGVQRMIAAVPGVKADQGGRARGLIARLFVRSAERCEICRSVDLRHPNAPKP